MSTIKVRWSVNELDNVMSLFDVQKVYRSPSGDDGTFVEITNVSTRVPLASGVTSYLYDDTAGDPSYYYAVSYFNSSTSDESGMSDPMRGDLSGYSTVEDIRNEGLAESEATDAQVVTAITRATRMIERITGLWFEPRTRTFRINKRQGRDILLNIPIVAVTGVKFYDQTIDIDNLWIFNRHLTQGLVNPDDDDRNNPRISERDEFDTDFYLRSVTRTNPLIRSPQYYTIEGVFGYTDLAPSVIPAETVEGSQIPADYGEAPDLIKYACARLVMRYAQTIASNKGGDVANASRLVEERTADQSYKLAAPASSSEDGSFGMTGDREVDQILTLYRRPMSMGAI